VRARVKTAERSAEALGSCLLAWSRGDDDVEAQAGARVVAEVLLMIRGALTKR